MANHALKSKARNLRTEGHSINAISQTLNAPKSTVSYWCRDIILTKAQVQNLQNNQRDGRRRGSFQAAEIKRATRISSTAASRAVGRRDIGTLTKRDRYMIGLALYWGEGFKRGNEECGITNCDPSIIRSFIHWLSEVYGAERKDLTLRITINSHHAHRSADIERYWSKATGVPRSQFTNASFIRTQKRAERETSGYVGTLRVKVRRATSLHRRIMGSLAEIERQLTEYTEIL